MSRQFEDSGFWLPSEFLTDDDLLTDFKSDRIKTWRFDDVSYCLENSVGFNSDLSSPGEVESEDDDLASELTPKLDQSTLRTSNFSSHHASKDWKLSGSPQSTLCGCKLCSTTIRNSVSGVFSTLDAEDYLRRDYLYAAEEVARMRMIEETAAFYASTGLSPQVKPCPSVSAGFYPSGARSVNRVSFHLLQAAKLQQQMMKKGVHDPRVAEFQLQNRRRNCGVERAQSLSMTGWRGLQQPGSRTREVFLCEPGPKKERTGTGVFLPKRFGSIPADTRKKSGCPTVLLPPKMVHALNLDVESIEAHIQRSMDCGTSNFDYAAAAVLKHRNNVMMAAQQRSNLALQPDMKQQLSLPPDWTY